MSEKTVTAIITEAMDGERLDAAVRQMLDTSWSKTRGRIRSGKISVEGAVVLDEGFPVKTGQKVVFTPDAAKPRQGDDFDKKSILFMDRQILVAKKPVGILSTPVERGDKVAFDRQIKRYLAATTGKNSKRRGALPSLMVVHRLDKTTSGVLVFARTMTAQKHLSQQFKEHTPKRTYIAIVHGRAATKRIESHIMQDRGDGLRGSSETSPHGGVRRSGLGQRAITNVELIRVDGEFSLVRCTLETGRTNQIRIHMGEDGHSIVGDTRYGPRFKDVKKHVNRIMLHAETLQFIHPTTGELMSFKTPLPDEFSQLLDTSE